MRRKRTKRSAGKKKGRNDSTDYDKPGDCHTGMKLLRPGFSPPGPGLKLAARLEVLKGEMIGQMDVQMTETTSL